MIERLGTLAIAAALLFVALRVHKSSGKHVKVTKPAGVVLSFLSGCAFLVTFVGGWMTSLAGALAGVAVAGLIVCAGIIGVDWAMDGRPDKPAFWAAFALALAVVVGASQLPRAVDQIGTGASQVTEQLSKVGQ